MPNAKFAPFNLKLEVSENIRNLKPYIPGKPIEQTKREYGLTNVIKLASNENPLGASPKALDATKKFLSSSFLYPDASYEALKNAIAKKRGLTVDHIVIGAGSNELIDLAFRVFAGKRGNAIAPRYSFIAYQLCAQLNGVPWKESFVADDMEVSVDSILETVDHDTRAVFLANPNNPTGSVVSSKEVRRLARELHERNVVLVLDYAYWEYEDSAEFPAAEQLLTDFPNLLVLHTFSKIYGLAGFRVGYGVGRPELVQWLERSRQPFNVSSIAIEAATAALNDQEFVERSIRNNKSGGQQLESGLQALGLRVFPSKGNFIFFDVGCDAAAVNLECLKRGVIVRPLANYGLPRHLRVTIGTESENARFLEVLKESLN